MIRRPLCFDTSVFVPYLRGEAYRTVVERTARTGRLRLSAVVLAELYAGTRSARDKVDLDVIERSYRTLGHLVTPEPRDWAWAGQAIRRYRAVYGAIDPREHLNDVLILLSAARVGTEVVTEEGAVFTRWARFLRRPGLPVRVRVLERRAHLDR